MRFFFLFIFIACSASCQKREDSKLSTIASLPRSLDEISGMVKLSDNSLLAINDSGNEPVVFHLNVKGDIQNEIKISNTKNIDWEDLAYGNDGTVYIGDFGNNQNDRTDLVIYKIANILSSAIEVSEITFRYEDQEDFPPKKKNFNFDVEAFIQMDKSLYLFTKNRAKNSKGITKIYQLPNIAGKHIAKLVGSYTLCDDPKDCLITGATINPDQNKIVLLSHKKIYLLTNFKAKGLENCDIQKIKLHHNSQKEAICFKNDDTLIISDEKTGKKNATLYTFSMY